MTFREGENVELKREIIDDIKKEVFAQKVCM
jgi:hypothetical protein